jgi:predicted GNAT family N-acyltransferase
MEIVDLGPLTPDQKRDLEGDEVDPFDERGITLQYRPKEERFGLRDDAGRLVAAAGLVHADVEVGARQFPVIGLGGVIVNLEQRGNGFARTVVEAAIERAAALGPDYVLLFCHEDRSGLYRKLGFSFVTDEVTVEQPEGLATMPQRAMWRAVRDVGPWPDGPVELHGFPF